MKYLILISTLLVYSCEESNYRINQYYEEEEFTYWDVEVVNLISDTVFIGDTSFVNTLEHLSTKKKKCKVSVLKTKIQKREQIETYRLKDWEWVTVETISDTCSFHRLDSVACSHKLKADSIVSVLEAKDLLKTEREKAIKEILSKNCS